MAITHVVAYSFMRCPTGVATRENKGAGKCLLHSHVLETEGMPIKVTQERHQGVRRKKTGVKVWDTVLLGFPREGQTGQGEYPRIASLHNCGQLWALGVVSSCLTPGPGMTKAETCNLLG